MIYFLAFFILGWTFAPLFYVPLIAHRKMLFKMALVFASVYILFIAPK